MKTLEVSSSWAIVDKHGHIMPYNGAMSVWETKFDADYQKLYYPKECGKLEVVQVRIELW